MDSNTEEGKDTNRTLYKIKKTKAKKLVIDAKTKVFEKMYTDFDTKEGKNSLFRLAKTKERRTRDLDQVRCMKVEEGQVLVEETNITLS